MGNQKIKPIIVYPISALFIAAIILGLVNPEAFLASEMAVVAFTMDWLGWLFGVVTIAMLFLCLYIFFSSKGDIILGGKEAKPLMSKRAWVSISLCGGIASGVVFWGIVEPLTHYAYPIPGLGLEPFSQASAVSSMGVTFYHWAIPYYVFYTICGIAVGYACYNMKLDYSVSSTLYPIFGKHIRGGIGKFTDIACLFAIAGGVSAVLGVISTQIASGIQFLFGIEATNTMRGIILLVVVIAFMLSSYTGLDKGVRFLSGLNTRIFLFFLLFVFIFGGTSFILSITWEGVGYMLDNFFTRATYLSTIDGEQWPEWWTVIYYAWSVGYGPMMGMFLGKIARGRSLKEFVQINFFIPVVFAIAWFGIFGGAAMNIQINSTETQLATGTDLWSQIGQFGTEASVFLFFDYFPLGSIFSFVFLLVAGLSVVTLCDSMSTTISAMSCDMSNDVGAEPPKKLKIFWAVLMSSLAFVNILTASTSGEISGIDATKQLVIATTGPLLIICAFQTYSVYKMMKHNDTYNIVECPETAKYDPEFANLDQDLGE